MRSPHAPSFSLRDLARSVRALLNPSAAVLFAGVCLLSGGCLGKIGDSRAEAAVTAAVNLEKDVRAANDKLKELSDKLADANETLGKKEFPAGLSTALGGINVPFDASNLDRPGLMGLPGPLVRALLRYTLRVEQINEDKDRLKNVLAVAQGPVEKAWKEEKEPVVNFSIVLRTERGERIAELVPNADPFKLDGAWPQSYRVARLVDKKVHDEKVDRWDKGPFKDGVSIAIPVDPATTAFTADRVVLQLRAKVLDLLQELAGDPSAIAETVGVLKEGDDLAGGLQKIAAAK